MDQVRWSRCIDVDALPAEVVALIDALAGGEELVITRGDEPIATVSPMATASVRPTAPARPAASSAGPSAGGDRVTIVASALHMSDDVRSVLSDSLGEHYLLLDFNAAPPTADVLLVPPGIGLTLLSCLRGSFPRARVMVVEAMDDSLGLSSNGPVRRLMDAGVESYLVSPTVPALAEQLEQAVTRRAQLTGGSGAAGRAGIGGRLAIDAWARPEH